MKPGVLYLRQRQKEPSFVMTPQSRVSPLILFRSRGCLRRSASTQCLIDTTNRSTRSPLCPHEGACRLPLVSSCESRLPWPQQTLHPQGHVGIIVVKTNEYIKAGDIFQVMLFFSALLRTVRTTVVRAITACSGASVRRHYLLFILTPAISKLVLDHLPEIKIPARAHNGGYCPRMLA